MSHNTHAQAERIARRGRWLTIVQAAEFVLYMQENFDLSRTSDLTADWIERACHSWLKEQEREPTANGEFVGF